MNLNYETIMEYVQLYFTTGVRWVCMGLAILVLLHQIVGLLKMRNPSEIWAYLRCPDGSSVPLTHWENLVGRARGCDIILNLTSVSRSHGTLIRDSEGVWKYNDLNSKNGSMINGKAVHEPTVLKGGDVLSIGGSDFELYPLSLQERMQNVKNRKRFTTTNSPWPSLFAITVFQLLTVIQFKVALAEEFPAQLPVAFGLLAAAMWAYVITMRLLRRNGFEIEIMAFFLCTLSLAVTATAYPSSVFKQSFCVLLGLALFLVICWLLRDLNRAQKLAYIFIGVSALLLIANLALGTEVNGSQNWMSIAGFTFQPSELVKITFIYIGATTLDELQQRKNLFIFMGFSVFCLGCLALMGDFGTAIIFFVTFLIISFLRSGDFTKLVLVIGAAGLMGMMVLRFKPHVAARFATWGHVWEDPTDSGFQQVQTLTSIASGGLPGLGAGEGNLGDVAAASTDMVFGLLSEEWGLVIAILAILCIITMGVFAQRSIIAGRSTYYSIAACAATSLFMFQTILNVFGSVDLIPFTGVTFPFVSSGGTSMIASWGLLAFLKAADTRQNASFAISLDRKSDYRDNLSEGQLQHPDDITESVAQAKALRPVPQMPQQRPADQVPQQRPADQTAYMKAVRPSGRQPAAHENAPGRDQAREPQIRQARSGSDDFFKAFDAVRDENKSVQKKAAAGKNSARKSDAGKSEADMAERPKAVKYTNYSDEEFFSMFGDSPPGRNTDRPSQSNMVEEEEDTAVTLDTLFGGRK